MARLLDQVLVIDLEATCWEGEPPAGQVGEIIEIGLCTVEASGLVRGERRCWLVRPVKSEVSDFCSRLTGITADMVTGEDVVSLRDAVSALKREFGSKDRLWASWGDYDRRMLERSCAGAGLGYPFGPSHLNVKSLAALALGWERELGLDEACARLGITMEGRHHRGVDDAWNIAGVLCEVLRRVRGGTG